jgi:hypothetical protein
MRGNGKMKKPWTILAGVSISVFLASFGTQGPKAQATSSSAQASSALRSGSVKVDPDFGKMPLYFVPNQGQVDAQVAYYLQGKDKTIYFTSEGLTYVLSERSVGGESVDKKTSAKERLLMNPAEREFRSQKDQSRWTVKLDFVGANADVQPSGEEKTEAVISYFKGKPEDWKAGLPTYSRIVYRDLWPGIDVAYYGTADKMKYEFVVHPGSDPSLIRLAYRGVSTVEVNGEGRLEVRTPAGGLEDDRPVGYQEIDGKRMDVALKYLLEEQSVKNAGRSGEDAATKSFIYGFEVGDYDRTKPLVLDPAVIVYCGYIGGSGYDEGYGIALDGSGSAYITGYAQSTGATFPVIGGPDLTHNGIYDAFVAKVNSSGTALVYCGYIGGSYSDIGNSIAVDGTGNAYITGETWSTEATFPVIGGPDLTYSGLVDAFVAKINASGTALIYCGYIGGSDYDYGRGIAVDGSGSAYVTGYTSSKATFPVIGGPDLTFNGGADAFVAKVTASGRRLVYCGYVGGSYGDIGNSIAVDGSGNAYVTGYTSSTEATFPVNVGPDLTYHIPPYIGGGPYDAFVAKVNAYGTALVYCGYIGGTGDDWGNGIAVDGSGNAYVTGRTFSTGGAYPGNGFPVIVGPDLTHNGGGDAFVAKVNASGTALVYCGYIGGSNSDIGNSIAVDGSGNAYVTGETASTEATFPVIGGPDLTQSGLVDAFVAKINASGTALVYCGYIGGSDYDYGRGIAVDGLGNAYVTGYTDSTEASFPVIGGPDLTYNSDYPYNDAFVAKIFTNESSAAITMISPNGGESWVIGSSQAIMWTTPETIDNVKLEYSTNGGATYVPIIASTPNTGIFRWTVPNTPSTICLVKASDAADDALNDVSNAVFSIIAETAINVTSPASGEAWIIGSTQGISWFSSGVSGNLNIFLYKGTYNLGAIATGIPVGNGVYNWKAGYLKNGTKVALGSTYRVSVTSAVNKNITAISHYFSLVKPKISVKTPVNGATWKFNSVQRITWTYSAVSGTVNIFLYRYGLLKGQVADSVPVSDLSFSWTVGALNNGKTAPIGSGYSVRVTTSDGKVSGKSPGTFTIRR